MEPCDDKTCGSYHPGFPNNCKAGRAEECGFYKPLKAKTDGGAEVPCSGVLCLLLKEMKEETNEYLKDFILEWADDVDGKTSDLLVARLRDFFDRKIYDIERKA